MTEEETLKSAITCTFKHYNPCINPRPHQWRTVAKVLADITGTPIDEDSDGKRRNYLIQHPTGSGKSLTIASLVLCLCGLKVSADRGNFSKILVLNDRSLLDAQLASAIIGFLEKNNFNSVVQSQDSKHLASILQDETLVVITTVQKFVSLAGSLSIKGKIAIIADEAHRTHGSKSSEKLHSLLTGFSVQSNSITYFSFTCTPSDRTLKLFGSHNEKQERPFYAYPIEEAVRDGIIMNVLQDYLYIGHEEIAKDLPVTNDVDDVLYHEIVKRKVKYIVEHFIHNAPHLSSSNFVAKGMIVVSGRREILIYKSAIEDYIKTNVADTKKFDVVCSFSQFQHGGRVYKETDLDVNKAYQRTFIEEYKNPKSRVKMIIVAEKLQTGFDEPMVSIMYIDRTFGVSGQAVQTLGRLSRISEGKRMVKVVDFKNPKELIVKAFNDFLYPGLTKEQILNEERQLLEIHKKNLILTEIIRFLVRGKNKDPTTSSPTSDKDSNDVCFDVNS
eukprot:TRINITY_DN5923_c0_g1_i1.p1 TRINITY_DN5923_c0_g1~~TRINITY_DN5923_c0_g1_i1.p1  ORF type:complete len:501 (+),score=73.70 TRINITY_DN5923_c0_g1_i1:15-1517(+)